MMTLAANQIDNVNGTSFYCEVLGSDAEPIIFVHSGMTDSGMWNAQWGVLGAHYNTIRYDRSGYGQSPMTQGLRANRDDLLALMDALGLERAHLVGCSMGGELVIDFALEHPQRVMSLTVVSSVASGFEMQGEPPKELFAFLGALEQGDAETAASIANQMYVVGAKRTAEQVSAEVQKVVHDMTLGIVRSGAIMQPDAQPLDPPAMTRLSEITVPTLFIAGQYDHPEILRAVDVLAAAIPNAQKAIIPDAAHFPNMEQPAEFNRIVLEFLAGVRG